MPSLADCLLVINLQNRDCKGERPVAHLDQLVKGVNARINAYRTDKQPIIFVQQMMQL
ncbi:isochorismatase [Latilactobacillus curvatus]|uniref:isochorismatase n=1 Tax=Latilactobacillus curvatus TaxID=28038 RepID=UPI001F088631|nr:isochorismatase [Latilactobacillus curvatus]